MQGQQIRDWPRGKPRSAQVSLEFIIVAGFAIVMLIAMLTIVLGQVRSAVNEGTLSGMEDVALTVQQELLTARSVGDGYERRFNLPADIQGRRYVLSLLSDGDASVVTVTLAGREISARAPRCEGTLRHGTNILATANGTITCAPAVNS